VNILLTGGAGYIGSHTAVVLIQAGHEVVLLDNFCNSDPSVLERLAKIVGKPVPCIEADVRDTDIVEKVLREYQVDAVIHFAGLKSVAESATDPILYYENNVCGSVSLIKAMQKANVKTIVFSSSACVYGDPVYLPYDEEHPTNPMNTYGWSKLQVEQILKSLADSDPGWAISCLRYFNPVGAHESGLIGESPNGIPNNLMPYIVKVASGELPYLTVYGNDYDTIDGTGVRDYIHVMDLAEGHLAALNFLKTNNGFDVVNLGTGYGSSVLQVITAYEKASSKPLAYKFGKRRDGDLPEYFGDTKKAKLEFGWATKRNLYDICQDNLRRKKL
jgi:UDP-glucose 4-epimerase